ncbi:transposase [Cesiribacter andamanensis]|uniref:Transposase n=1 Tax=Cesiribacter andamanensis AMV16 TaxID=1279009 RepID=M7N6T9_9BACT|nr:transposase [Cesiribacter andamanensis]EMR02997.1 Transposase [Cesiribacter andamanensis AMV16]
MEGDAGQNHISFYTATILGWKQLLKPDKYKNIAVESLRFLVLEKRVKLYGFVIMPNHIHLLWRMLPDWRLESVQRDFMKYTSQMIKLDLRTHHPLVLEKFYVGLKDRQYQFWQRNSLSKVLSSRYMVEQKLNYIHNNPVQGKWLLADSPLGYTYSSVRFYEEGDKTYDFLTHYLEDLG